MDLIQEDENKQSDSEVSLGALDNLYNKYISVKIRRTKLWNEVCSFARWVEYDAASLARQRNQDEIWIDLDPEVNVKRLWIDAVEDHEVLLRHRVLWDYLVSLGISKLCLDPRLEMNQIQDFFVFIKSREKTLLFRERTHSNAVSTGLLHGRSIHFSCANVILKDNVLFVKYSYCTLRYSHLVHWFEQRHKSFRDHRSLFHMAPSYGLIGAAVIFLPSILFAGWYRQWFLLAALLASAFVLCGMIYLFMMIVGSVEYDNEEKAYRLSRAYTQLKFYASRVAADIRRARTIQQSFLPDASKMPMCQLIDWASSYQPADEIGGDYFDIKALDDERVVIIFGDVCGHGIAAALITAVIKTTFQSWLERPGSLKNFALQLNRNVYFTTPVGDFAAVFLAIFNGKTQQLEYINCGHQPEPWLLRGTTTGPIDKLDQAPCMILGVEENIEIEEAVVSLQPGDGILIVSDGIIENQDIEGKLYGQERFEELLRNNNGLSVSELAQLITREADSFSEGTSVKDDQTLLGFRIRAV